ncbi:MAG: hypothetical protein R1F52_04185 [Candidatus Nitrosoabyssus spongiisocia]|nr:MAG: hypothetical protein R1F52_04185 [Nitrosopumilaceae archaeon AB1(1)]
MPKWKKDATEFIVGVNYHSVRGAQTTLPKPIAKILKEPTSIKFKVKGKKIEISTV